MTATRTTPASRVNSTAILAIVLVSFFMIILDNSIIFTGLPRIQADLGYGEFGLSWATNAYTLVFGGFLLLGARSGDLLGRRRMFIVGLVIFATASLLITVAPFGWWMITARALQGFGGALIAPLSLSLLTSNFPEGPERIRAVSFYGATAGIGAATGLVVGGALAEWVTWRAGFFINVPIGIVLIVAARRCVPETARQRGSFDVVGAVLSTLGVGGIVLGIINSADFGVGHPAAYLPLIVGGALIVMLIVNEARVGQPIMPLSLFRSRQRSGAYLARLLFGAMMMSYFYFISQFLQGVYGFTAFQTGLSFLPMTVASFAVAVNVPRMSRRVPPSILMTAGFVLLTIGIGWLALVHADSPYLTGIAIPMVVFGLGQGFALGPLTGAGIAGATPAEAGPASGMVNTTQQLGGTLGIAGLVAITTASGDPLAGQVSTAFTGGTILAATALVVVLVLIVPGEFAARRARHVATTAA